VEPSLSESKEDKNPSSNTAGEGISLTGGFVGRGLHANLSEGVLSDFEIGEAIFHEYLGGYGLAVRLILEQQPPKVPALAEDNILAFAPGLLSGTNAPFSGRFGVAGKSPLTGVWGDANAGGYFGPELKKSGYDIVLVSGISSSPVYLSIDNGHPELRDAAALWGKDTVDTDALIRRELNQPSAQVACIGPAGEKLSLISCVMTDGGRAAGRSGLGALMGSKRLKAVAVRGEHRVPVADDARFEEVSSKIRGMFEVSLLSRIGAKVLGPLQPLLVRLFGSKILSLSDKAGRGTLIESFRKAGTASGLSLSVASGDAPVKNWRGTSGQDFSISRAERISGGSVTKYQRERYSCSSCPMGCGGLLAVEGDHLPSQRVHRPEYETLAAFGSLILNDDVESIVRAADLCNRYGLDTISAGATIAFVLECYEHGLLTRDDTGGADLRWGDEGMMLVLLRQMGEREGFGGILTDGAKKASERIGRGSEKYAIHIAGEEPGMHDPRATPSHGTTYLVDGAPGRHTPSGASFAESMGLRVPLDGIELPKIRRQQYAGKGETHKVWSSFIHSINALGLCTFGATGTIATIPILDLLNAATGWSIDAYGLLTIGERIQTARHLFNLTEGVDPARFALPDRLKGVPPLTSGPSANVTIDINALTRDYYIAMGWDPNTTWPSVERLETLGLKGLADQRGANLK
jgi:aldehyde:ferredoxin oxidoreductase